MKYTVLLLFLFACSQKREQKPATTEFLQSSFHLQKKAPDILAMENALAGHAIYSRVKDELDLFSTELLTSTTQENVLIYIIRFKDKNKVYAAKAQWSKGLTVTDEVLYSGKMLDPQNGTIGLLRNDDAILISFQDGSRSIKPLDGKDYDAYFTTYHGGPGFCQRESGESFGACFKAETDEFCDSFFSCAALATQPQVSLIIGLACSCQAAPPIIRHNDGIMPLPDGRYPLLDTLRDKPINDSL